jgi:HEAT repeat protein
VAAVKSYLTDETLCEPATQTMLSTGSKSAAQAFLDALPVSAEKNKATLVKALGELKCVAATEQITPFIKAGNPELKKAALAALANIGHPNSFKILLNAAKEVNFAYEPTNAAEAFLHYANRLAENNETELCKKACREIFKANTSANQLHNYSKALAIYTSHFGTEAMPFC